MIRENEASSLAPFENLTKLRNNLRALGDLERRRVDGLVFSDLFKAEASLTAEADRLGVPEKKKGSARAQYQLLADVFLSTASYLVCCREAMKGVAGIPDLGVASLWNRHLGSARRRFETALKNWEVYCR